MTISPGSLPINEKCQKIPTRIKIMPIIIKILGPGCINIPILGK